MKQYEKDGQELIQQQIYQSTFTSTNRNSISTYDDHASCTYRKSPDFCTQEPHLLHVQRQPQPQQQQATSPEREIEIPIPEETSDAHIAAGLSRLHDSKYAATPSNSAPILSSMERGGETLEEDGAFDDILDMAFVGTTRAAVGMPYRNY